jgi:hypothetical protein
VIVPRSRLAYLACGSRPTVNAIVAGEQYLFLSLSWNLSRYVGPVSSLSQTTLEGSPLPGAVVMDGALPQFAEPVPVLVEKC